MDDNISAAMLFVAVWVPITPKVEKQRTANIHDDLENSSEQRQIDSIEEPVRKKGRPEKVLAESQPAKRPGRQRKIA